MHSAEYSTDERRRLLGIARASMTHGVETGAPLPVALGSLPEPLTRQRATFVTLHLRGVLRGCTGRLHPAQPLAVDVAHTACSAALSDPRFLPVRHHELDAIMLEVSVLTPLIQIPAHSEEALLDTLVPGVDGLVLSFGEHSATFLPKVWEQLPDPEDFVAALKQKAGLSAGFWSPALSAHRYRTETFAESSAE